MYRDVIEKVPSFRDQHPDLLAMVVSNLRPEYYMSGDVIICQVSNLRPQYYLHVR